MADAVSPVTAPRVALIGFGEAGETFARAGKWHGHARGIDLLRTREAIMPECGVENGSPDFVLGEADIILSLVTADQAGRAAEFYGRHLRKGSVWCDMNSVSPQTKRGAAPFVESAGAAYVDVAVMAPVDKGLSVPLLLAGAAADRAGSLLAALGFANIRTVGEEVGRASAIKLCRSVMVKGLEALTAEMVLAATQAGVLDEVLASLDASEKAVSWQTRADYNLDRMLIHGGRRSEEMREAATMLRELGVAPLMTDNTVARQAALGELGLAPPPDGLNAKLDAIRATQSPKGDK